jgi:hypothetical protein
MHYIKGSVSIPIQKTLKEIQMSLSFTPVISVSLTAASETVFVKTAKKESDVRAANALARAKAVNVLLDAMFVACDKPKAEFLKGNAKTNDARGQIKAFFDGIVEKGALTKATAENYQSGFWIAFNEGTEWAPDLNNKKSKAKGDAKADTPKSGKVSETNVPELHKTLSKALAQARILNQSIFAADLVDLITDTWPDFKETVLTK